MSLIEIIVSMVILVVAALAVTSTISLVNNAQMRSADVGGAKGGSPDLQAASYARETLEALKNHVSTDPAKSAALNDVTGGAACAGKTADQLCGAGTLHTSPPDAPPLAGLDGTSTLASSLYNGTRYYRVWDVASGDSTPGKEVAYKQVTVCVAWAPDTTC